MLNRTAEVLSLSPLSFLLSPLSSLLSLLYTVSFLFLSSLECRPQ
jgi:hypothetical protein